MSVTKRTLSPAIPATSPSAGETAAIMFRVPVTLLRKLLVALGAISLGLLVAAGTVSVLAASPDPSPSGSATPVPTASAGTAGAAAGLPGDPQKGQQIYNQNCTACHGASMEGGVGPKLNPLAKIPGVPAYTKITDPQVATYLIDTITNGKNDNGQQMPAKGGNSSLTDQDVKDLAAFIINSNNSGKTNLSPVDLARSNVFWVTVGIAVMVLLTYLLARYNMRWIGMRAEARKESR